MASRDVACHRGLEINLQILVYTVVKVGWSAVERRSGARDFTELALHLDFQQVERRWSASGAQVEPSGSRRSSDGSYDLSTDLR